MALVADFKTRFPEFDTAEVDQYVPILEGVWPCYYGGDYNDECDKEAILNLVAHLLVSESSSSFSTIKDVNSKTVRSVSVSYGAMSASKSGYDDWLRATKYGQRFLMLTRSRIGAYFV